MPQPYADAYEHLRQALRAAPGAQLELLAATDETYAYMERAGDALTDDEVLGLRVLLGQAETILGRYFGM